MTHLVCEIHEKRSMVISDGRVVHRDKNDYCNWDGVSIGTGDNKRLLKAKDVRIHGTSGVMGLPLSGV